MPDERELTKCPLCQSHVWEEVDEDGTPTYEPAFCNSRAASPSHLAARKTTDFGRDSRDGG